MEYSRHRVRVDNHLDVEQVLQSIASLPGVIVVNIALAADATSVFFSKDNLRAALASAPDVLWVEAVRAAEHRELMRAKVERVILETSTLRTLLGTRHVAEAAAEVTAFLAELDRVLLLLENFTLQGGRAEAIETLQAQRLQLEASSCTHRDNVRCMDDLRYEILPTLTRVLKSIDGPAG